MTTLDMTLDLLVIFSPDAFIEIWPRLKMVIKHAKNKIDEITIPGTTTVFCFFNIKHVSLQKLLSFFLTVFRNIPHIDINWNRYGSNLEESLIISELTNIR